VKCQVKARVAACLLGLGLTGLAPIGAQAQTTTDLLFGARMLDIEQTLNWTLTTDVPGQPTLGRSGSASASGTNWDAIVGIKGRYYLGAERKWFLPYYADVGTGQSKFTWQVNAGVGYQFGWGSLYGTYRYLDYQFKSDKTLQSMTLNGVLIGVAFQF
jgi:hypothetical protein